MASPLDRYRKVLFPKRNVGDLGSKMVAKHASLQKMDFLNSKAKLQFEHDIEVGVSAREKELHEQRLQSLRNVADKLKDDDWKYEPIENLLGFK
ncbi:uncharacterized protein LOC135391732 isoform X1 [Ornithodoros turicata]|uniref:uncharacterized protein LOC135391732 isoform X1 n=1 Tax=Ornithodoros turicata TaxID=34597 RepID=UPI003138D8DE